MTPKARLATLRQQAGATRPASAPEGLLPWLHRIRSAAAAEQREQQVARALQGRRVTPGLIVIEQRLPLTYRHGRWPLAAATTLERLAPLLGEPVRPEELLFLDTETTGLAGGTGTLVFLLGLGRLEGESLRLQQLLLTGFRGEAALLQEAAAACAGRRYLVTFNGKCFDVPLIATRYRLSRQDDPFASMQHLDLLPLLRQAFARRWPDCRLLTAEQRLLGFARAQDLPAAAIPEAWFAFVRHGTTHLLPAILRHNRWDLLSLVTLLPSLGEAFMAPGESGADPVAAARFWWRRGDEQAAVATLQRHRQHLDQTGLHELAHLYRRRRQWEAAVAIWEALAREDDPAALLCLAKYYEHVRRDYPLALHYTERLLQVADTTEAHQQRRQRLSRKLARHRAAGN
ncbi:MAG: hypothetical protein KatS3mg131_0466 [Candidatus Tectimicrobiota bacterium]|nr:MAG: hypothetical protein KatS3mg131_0466 [Candidatus Tectomicrobia bacterium]